MKRTGVERSEAATGTKVWSNEDYQLRPDGIRIKVPRRISGFPLKNSHEEAGVLL